MRKKGYQKLLYQNPNKFLRTEKIHYIINEDQDRKINKVFRLIKKRMTFNTYNNISLGPIKIERDYTTKKRDPP